MNQRPLDLFIPHAFIIGFKQKLNAYAFAIAQTSAFGTYCGNVTIFCPTITQKDSFLKLKTSSSIITLLVNLVLIGVFSF
jgi:hypothetical protein